MFNFARVGLRAGKTAVNVSTMGEDLAERRRGLDGRDGQGHGIGAEGLTSRCVQGARFASSQAGPAEKVRPHPITLLSNH